MLFTFSELQPVMNVMFHLSVRIVQYHQFVFGPFES